MTSATDVSLDDVIKHGACGACGERRLVGLLFTGSKNLVAQLLGAAPFGDSAQCCSTCLRKFADEIDRRTVS
jgi:hypothetical protein